MGKEVDSEAPNTGLVSGEPRVWIDPERKNNFPPKPCPKQCFHVNFHEIEGEASQKALRKAFIAWIFLIIVFVWNGASVLADFIIGTGGLVNCLLGLTYVVGGPIVTFYVYMCLYSAARKRSPMYYCCYLIFFTALTVIFGIFAIGVSGWGGGGATQISPASAESNVVAVMLAISMSFWILVVLTNIFMLYYVRKLWQAAGGMEATKKETVKAGAKTAYDNRETIKDVAYENREVIKEVAIENKDLIREAAKDNKDLLIDVAIASQSEGRSAAGGGGGGLKIRWEDYD